MDIDGAVGRRVQDILRQNTAIGRHHDQLRCQFLHQGQGGTVPQLQRLIDRQVMGQGIFLDRRKGQLMAAVFRLIRLGKDAADLVSGFHQRVQRGHRKIRRAHK